MRRLPRMGEALAQRVLQRRQRPLAQGGPRKGPRRDDGDIGRPRFDLGRMGGFLRDEPLGGPGQLGDQPVELPLGLTPPLLDPPPRNPRLVQPRCRPRRLPCGRLRGNPSRR